MAFPVGQEYPVGMCVGEAGYVLDCGVCGEFPAFEMGSEEVGIVDVAFEEVLVECYM